MKIRKATRGDADAVRHVYMAAFPEGERDIVSGLAVELLSGVTSPPTLTLLAEVDGALVGHVCFSPVTARATKDHLGFILAPLAVSPDFQKRGIASQLIEHGIELLSARGAGILLVYGDPAFYSRYGFSAAYAEYCIPPYKLQYAFGWQGMALRGFDAPQTAVDISCVPSLSHPALW